MVEIPRTRPAAAGSEAGERVASEQTTGDAPPRVTIAIPTYNRPHFLREAIESALAQSFSGFEVLVLDDHSTDETAEVVRAYADDPRLRYVRHEQNIGMTANWNAGFELARGDLVSLLHDDDRWHPRFLERAVAAFERRPDAAFAYAHVERIDATGRVIGGTRLGLPGGDTLLDRPDAVERMARRCEVSVAAVLVRREALLEIGGFSDRYPFSMDWQAWIRMAALHPVCFLDEVLGYEREHENRLTDRLARRPLGISTDRFAMLEQTIPALSLPEAPRRALARSARRSLARTQLVMAWDFATRGQRRRAWTEATYAFRIDRAVALRAPTLAAAAFVALVLPPSLTRRLDALRRPLRPLFRRD